MPFNLVNLFTFHVRLTSEAMATKQIDVLQTNHVQRKSRSRRSEHSLGCFIHRCRCGRCIEFISVMPMKLSLRADMELSTTTDIRHSMDWHVFIDESMSMQHVSMLLNTINFYIFVKNDRKLFSAANRHLVFSPSCSGLFGTNIELHRISLPVAQFMAYKRKFRHLIRAAG